MDGGAVVGLIFVLVLAVGLGVLFESAKADDDSREVLPTSALRGKMQPHQASSWQINIMRRSGYVHSSWTYSGSKLGALDFAIAKLQKAKIEMVEIRRNDPGLFEVTAAYDSSGQRRTGRYVGGFTISPA